MSSKRLAEKYLTDSNYLEEDSENDSFGHTLADDSVIAGRDIKKAKKKLPRSTPSDSEKPSIFSNFTAFTNANTNSNSLFTNSMPSWEKTLEKSPDLATKDMNNFDENRHIKYLKDLRGLNASFSDFLKTSLASNPILDVGILLDQYKTFRQRIELENKKSVPTTQQTPQFSSLFSIAPQLPSINASNPPLLPSSSLKVPETKLPTINSFSSAATFSLGPTIPFNSSYFAPPSTLNEKVTETDHQDGSNDETDNGPIVAEELQNPDVVRRGAGEEDEKTLFELRCKVFHWKEQNWIDVGVGFLKLNQDNSTEKTRLLVRSEGTGKVLINLSIFSGLMITHEVGKKAVVLASLDQGKNLVKYLVMTRIPDDAASLVKMIEERKSK